MNDELFPPETWSRGMRDVRKRRGLTLGDLAARVGVTVSHLSQIERGKRSPSVCLLKKLSEELEAPMRDLL